jgi:SAM-dependent methyltransferase
MITSPNLYDELPYKSHPIEWTAPERLALASLLHGGPRPPLDAYRCLELGCGDGANLLPLAYYRTNASFVGIDGASTQVTFADSRKRELKLSNIEFLHADFRAAAQQISGEFDFIMAHGVFSWVPDDIRDALLELCAQRLRPGGLLYLNYNTRPGWNMRGLVREFLLANTAGIDDLRTRSQMAHDVSAKIVSGLARGEHPYSQLLANEFRFVCENDLSYVAHEYLAPDNHPYWRGEFMALLQGYGFGHVADADFSYSSGRIAEDLPPRLESEQITGRTLEETVDLLCYRQLHSPILTQAPLRRRQPDSEEFGKLLIASCLTPCAANGSQNPMFQHPSGYQVEAKEEIMRSALNRLQPLWPRGMRVDALFPHVGQVMDDLKLLQRNGLIELRCIEPGEFATGRSLLKGCSGDYVITPYHTRESDPAVFEAESDDSNRRLDGQQPRNGNAALDTPVANRNKHDNVGRKELYPI